MCHPERTSGSNRKESCVEKELMTPVPAHLLQRTPNVQLRHWSSPPRAVRGSLQLQAAKQSAKCGALSTSAFPSFPFFNLSEPRSQWLFSFKLPWLSLASVLADIPFVACIGFFCWLIGPPRTVSHGRQRYNTCTKIHTGQPLEPPLCLQCCTPFRALSPLSPPPLSPAESTCKAGPGLH